MLRRRSIRTTEIRFISRERDGPADVITDKCVRSHGKRCRGRKMPSARVHCTSRQHDIPPCQNHDIITAHEHAITYVLIAFLMQSQMTQLCMLHSPIQDNISRISFSLRHEIFDIIIMYHYYVYNFLYLLHTRSIFISF